MRKPIALLPLCLMLALSALIGCAEEDPFAGAGNAPRRTVQPTPTAEVPSAEPSEDSATPTPNPSDEPEDEPEVPEETPDPPPPPTVNPTPDHTPEPEPSEEPNAGNP